MPSRVLTEQSLHVFLRRRRRAYGVVERPALAPLLADVMGLASRLVPAEGGVLLLDDPTTSRRKRSLTLVAAFGPGAETLIGRKVPAERGLVGQVYTAGKVEVHQNLGSKTTLAFPLSFAPHSLVAYPVVLEQAVCGVFGLFNRKRSDHFNERDVELVGWLAEHISRAILNAVDILKQNELALSDDLTTLRNVRGLGRHLEETVKDARTSGEDAAVLFIDVDFLKRINDRHGHAAGSQTIRVAAETIQRTLGPHGTAYRFGGDEFVVICPRTEMAEAKALADKMRRAVSEAKQPHLQAGGRNGSTKRVTISIGVATLHSSLVDPDAKSKVEDLAPRMLSAADKALYRAKRRGRRRTVAATPNDDTLVRGKRRRTLRSD